MRPQRGCHRARISWPERSRRQPGRYVTGVASALIVLVASMLGAQSTRTVQDGVFTDAQATRGQTLYVQQCSSCHGTKLQGVSGPPLQGELFVSHWQLEPLS